MSRIEEDVINKIRDRALTCYESYGQSMERTDLSRLDWLKHLQEEMLDSAIYLQKLIEIEQHSHAANYES